MDQADDIFFSPKLKGERFDNHTLPVSVAQDFAAVEECLIYLARKIYLDDHPDRKRLPKGFMQGVNLQIKEIEDGSAITNLILAVAHGVGVLAGPSAETVKYMTKARNVFVEMVGSAAKGETSKFDKSISHYFHRFGRHLGKNESIDLGYGTSKEQYKPFTREVRRQILLSANPNTLIVERISVDALVGKTDKINKKVTFLIDGKELTVKYEQKFLENIHIAFGEFEKKRHVRLDVDASINGKDQIVKLNKIHDVNILDPFDVSLRLKELSGMHDNWYQGTGKAASKESLEEFEAYFYRYFSAESPLPAIFPTVEGGLQLEWKIDSKELIVEVDFSDMTGSLFSFDHSGKMGDLEEENIDMRSEDGWLFVQNIIKTRLVNG